MAPRCPKVRHDLVYRVDPADDSYYYVKDPIAGQFYRFNELQVTVMQALDGETSAEDMVELLEEELEVEVPVASVQRMIARFEERFLLDVTSYRIDSEKDRALVRKVLRKRGLIWRGMAKSSENRRLSQETILFQEGIRLIEHGDPCDAGRCFLDVLALNPENQRARDILNALHQAFFERHKKTPAYLQMVRLFNPDRFLGVVDRKIGRFVFSPWAVVLLVVLLLGAALSIRDTSSVALDTLGWTDVLLAFFVVHLASKFLHELGHGLACKHYGGSVPEIGVMLMYGVLPAPYCDTTDSYVFPEKKHKVMTQLAGPFVTTCCLCVEVIAYEYSSDAFLLRNAILITIFNELGILYWNLAPFLKFDSYYALSDYLDVRNLQERAMAFVTGRWKERLLGIPHEGEDPSAREKRIFWWYGTSSVFFTTAMIYYLWISFLLPLAIEHLGVWGILFTAAYALNLTLGLLLPGVAKLIRLLYAHRKEVFTLRRMAAYGVVGLTLFGVLSIPRPFYVDGTSVVAPLEKRSVNAQEVGLVSEVLVREGQKVSKGDVVARLQNDELVRRREKAGHQLVAAHYRLIQLYQGPRPEELELARARVRGARKASRYARRQARRQTSLSNAQLLSKSDAMEASRRAKELSAADRQAELTLQLAEVGTRKEDIDQMRAEVEKLESLVSELDERIDQLELRAPIDGVVVGSRLEELRYRRLGEGEKFCEIQDLSGVRVEVSLRPNELYGVIHPGQRVTVRMLGDPHKGVDGLVAKIRPSSREDGSMVVELEEQRNPGWTSGMTGHARIYGEDRTIAYRVFGAPILRLISYEAWSIFS